MLFKILFIIFLITNIKCDVDECFYAIQRKEECFKIPKNNLDENCCYLEMEMNQIFTTACIRVKNNPDVINRKIFTIKNEEDNYKFENLNIECFSHNLPYYIYNAFLFCILIL